METKNSSSQFLKSDGGKTKSNAIEVPSISLPKGGGAIKGIDEKFSVNAVNGTASFSVPLPISPGRNGFAPALGLTYNSGSGNSPYGLGWGLGYPSIQRKTDAKLPRYLDDGEDIFLFSGAEDLVPFLEYTVMGEWTLRESTSGDYTIKQYRPRIEGGFARIEKISYLTNGTYWKITSPDNVATIFGRNANSRIADPENANRIYEWLPEFAYDDKGNWIKYEYKAENLDNVPNSLHEKNRLAGLAPFTNRYLKSIKYGNHKPYYVQPKNAYDPLEPTETRCFFELVMDYGEHDELAPTPEEMTLWTYRADAFSAYRSGFEIRTNRLCKRILMFHHFPEEKQYDDSDFGTNYLVRSLKLAFQPSSVNNSGQTEVTYLQSITQTGYVRKPDRTYSQKSLPPMEFDYQDLEWNKKVKTVPSESVANTPIGLGKDYQWIDLYGEGIAGILTEQGTGWFYKSNLGPIDNGNGEEIQFGKSKPVIPRPSLQGISNGVLSLQDLESNGEKQLVVESPGLKGYYSLNDTEDWERFQAFETTANINPGDSNIRRFDLNGDGQPELVISEENAFIWYAANGKKGYEVAERTAKTYEEELGPAIVFSDHEQSIFLADVSGDGLTDIVRIRNGEICYWANKGYGNFSAKVSMTNAPLFDLPEQFNPAYLHLADVSGTGATDLIYLGKNTFKAFINLSGNAWSDAHEIDPFLPIDSNVQLSVVDLLGTGTSCIVWSSNLPIHAQAPMRYIDLMSSKKPHVMTSYKNNMGMETRFEHKSSTHYYLKDKREGNPWITKLPFPVQVVSRMTVEERITNVKFSTEYHYHHGYFDHTEREFRGFGMVEQIDTELYQEWKANNAETALENSESLYQAPVRSKTWTHTGAFLSKEKILRQFSNEYFQDDEFEETHLDDARIILPEGMTLSDLSSEEYREALRACKSMTLRQEVYADDASKNADKPYTTGEHNCHIRMLQPRLGNAHAVFMVVESEALSYTYDRNISDPRISHSLNIEIDEWGNVLESAAVVYGRNPGKSNSAFQEIKDSVTDFGNFDEKDKLKAAFETALNVAKDEQLKSHIIYSKNTLTNNFDELGVYRLKVPAEALTYEISGLTATNATYSIQEFEAILTDNKSTEIPYQTDATTGVERRLIEHIRSIYLADDLIASLPLNTLGKTGLPFESYQLAFTPDLLTHIYGDKLTNPTDTMQEGRFVHSEGDDNWWIRSGIVQLIDDGNGESVGDAENRFFSPLMFTDPFGATTTVSYYKDYFLFIESTTDVLLNKASIERFNFRTLSPITLRDINDNLSTVVTDELGLVKASALLGKDLDVDGIPELEICDHLVGFTESSEADATMINDFFETEDSEVLKALGKTLLQGASSRVVYNFETFRNTGNPAVTASIVREEHNSVNLDSRLQFSFEYSDGAGQVVMTKAQAEPGKAKKVNVDVNGNYTVMEVDTSTNNPKRLRWIGNGRTVLNNKGNPVKQYEPYFSITPHFEAAKELVETGVTPILYYDPIGRLIKTLLPDGNITRVTFDSWQQNHFDAGDTVLDAENEWYKTRIAGDLGTIEKTAAQKSEIYADTPNSVFLDSLGRPILSLDHNGKDANNKSILHATIMGLDIEGNSKHVIDARGNIVMEHGHDMLGNQLWQKSMDAGIRWMLNNVLGNPVKSWDERQHIFSFNYDVAHRPLEMKVEGGDGELVLDNTYEKIEYGEGLANDKENNWRGQIVANYDTAGKTTFEKYDLKGAVLESSRRFSSDYKAVVDWSGMNIDSKLEMEAFPASIAYDALERVTETTSSDGSLTKPTYNEAGLLEKVWVKQPEEEKFFVENIDYNEKGQRTRIKYGSGAVTTYQYDELNSHLKNLSTKNALNQDLQALHYTYDPIGNITHVEDKAIPAVFFNNQKIEATSLYTYDPLYQLIEAEGREHAGQALNFDQFDNWKDAPFLKSYAANSEMDWRTYKQKYEYDTVGNILKMAHGITSAGMPNNWNRTYAYESSNNRLTSTQVGNRTYTYASHSEHGFMEEMPHLQWMKWNFNDELQQVSKQKVVIGNGLPEITYYVYNSSGERVRKITENSSTGNTTTKKNERYYLGDVEVFRDYDNAEMVKLERKTVHVSDDTGRIAMIETKTIDNPNDDSPKRLLRYQFSNHLGSATLETNDVGEVISYEEYHPYGTTAYQAVDATTKAAAKRYRYTGMERDDESGFNYHSARYYLPWLGRWSAPDPIGVKGEINLYGAMNANPITFNDRSGEVVEDRTEGTDDLWVKYKQEVTDIRNKAEYDVEKYNDLITIAHNNKNLSNTSRYLLTRDFSQSLKAAQHKLKIAKKALEEARQLEDSFETYVIMYNEQMGSTGLFSTVAAPPSEELAGKLVLSINRNKAKNLRQRILTLAHEVVHAHDFETGVSGAIYDPRPTGATPFNAPSYDIHDEVKAFQREQDLFGEHKGQTINATWTARRSHQYGILNHRRPESITMNTIRKTDNIEPGAFANIVAKYKREKGREITHKEYYGLWAKLRGRQGQPLGATVIYKGLISEYLEARLVNSHGLRGVK